jgi:SET domain-containing protein
MNLVKTYLDKDNFGGIGLFAGEFIAKDTLIWELQEDFDKVINKEDFVNLSIPMVQKKFFLRYAYEMNGKMVLCNDDARFANHSNEANTFDKQFANKDIQKGEEIFCNYFEINDEFSEEEFNELKSFKP